MTKVIHLAGRIRAAGNPVQMSAHAPERPLPNLAAPARQAAIENALTMALYFVRQPGDSLANLWAATARTNRALTLLKQASEDTAAVPRRA